MKSVIVGTAGHIDHGKTTLVKALTGIDADRLEEEKRRGITIDLGFANLELESDAGETLRLGFVDVPGHERFVRNMLAGVGGIDIVLLVIAADEGVKPQTREHFEICRLLAIPRGIVVLTKADMVDAETLGVVRLEIEDFLRGSFLDAKRTPVVPVSAITGMGIVQLKSELARVAAEASGRSTVSLARLPVDRAFVMKGFGTVVTGTLIAGTIRREQELELQPSGQRVRARGIQVHGAATEQAHAGERTAVNLAGVAVEELARGMMLAEPGSLEPSRQIDVRLDLLPDAKPLRHLSRVHLHCFASETVAQVRLLELKELKAGGSMLAQLRPVEPLLVVPGDRFIIRQFSPVVTIGGGIVLDAFPLRRSATDAARAREFLNKLEAADSSETLALRIERRGVDGLSASAAVKETGRPRAEIEGEAQKLVGSGRALSTGELLLSKAAALDAAKSLLSEVEAFHKGNPLVAGIAKETLREKIGLREPVFAFLIARLSSGKKLELQGEQVRLAGRGVNMSAEEQRARKTIEQAFLSTGLKVPLLKDVLGSLSIDQARSHKIVTLLLREGVLVKLGDELVFHRSALDHLRKLIALEKSKSPKIDVGRFKDLLGVTRKHAIPLLEYLDRERITRRVGDVREIL
ncbi:MAG: selenocysteine-specific translation elongation factor [Acidobacteria bacterium]|nr:selenocysteine-specific translation elongation factor [Acidobacteriota bacterium]MBV9144998.1 selenocysteine-specific translation elongation factor [Acidobacteriota bacterium]MBV9435659.1 selenocysteine-specific translation elongation factor [Acidobacteriota bacterium]